jgi:type VI secretion system protein ImpM
MPGLRPVTGIFGKVPAHGDFVRRGLPTSFVAPWDAWLQAGIACARERLGGRWEAAWDQAPAWRFLLPAGACGPDAVAGVMLPSEDMVGRRFPITLAALLPAGAAPPEPAWFDALEEAARAGRLGRADADALAAAVPVPGVPLPPRPSAQPPIARPEPRPGRAAEEPPPAPADAPQDVLGLFASDEAALAASLPPEGAPPAAEPDAGAEEDVLALLAGAAAPPAPEGPDPGADVLALFAAAPSRAPADAEPTDRGEDGTLAFLLGTAGAAPAPAAGSADPLPLPQEEAALTAREAAAIPGPDESSATAEGQGAAPPCPAGGGWWTRGGARLPPMVWALPGLPSPAEFIHLLGIEA